MELMLDTANIDEITEGIGWLSVSGITTNPTILKRERPADFFAHLKKIKSVCKNICPLHVQVSSGRCDEMLDDAERIIRELGSDTFVKIPVTQDGLAAIKALSATGRHVTATAIYSTVQGALAMMSGAQYLAVYYNRMMNMGADPDRVIRELSGLLASSNSDCKILGASFKNTGQLVAAFVNGAESCTASYDILKAGANFASVRDAVDVFNRDWKSMYGDTTIAKL